MEDQVQENPEDQEDHGTPKIQAEIIAQQIAISLTEK